MKRLLLLTGFMIFAGSALAGTFQISPTRLTFEANGKISSITVFNQNDSAANMQVRAMRWSQAEETGRAQMDESQDLIVFPKIFSVPAQGQKVIRVGYQGKPLVKELAFRLFIRELPVEEPGKTGMKFAVRMSMPVFIRPAGAGTPEAPRVTGLEIYQGQLAAQIQNRGKLYFMMSGLELSGSKGGKEIYTGKSNGWYVLPGVSKLFAFDISRDDCNKLDSLTVVAKSGAGDGKASFPVDGKLCAGINIPVAQDKTHAEK